MQKVTIKVPSRIHFNLIGMHDCSFRQNGGFGVAVDTGLTMDAMKSSEQTNMNYSVKELSKTALKITQKVQQVKDLLDLPFTVKITLENEIVPHIGLGSATSLTLAAIESLLIINNYNYSPIELQELSGRGGTSGVGIHSYFTGGFVYDLGTKATNVNHAPSGYLTPASLPTLLFRKDYPFGNITFLYPKSNDSSYGEREYNFFKASTPLADHEAFQACYNSLFMVSASLLQKDEDNFIRAIDNIKDTKWKKLEIINSGVKTQDLLDEFLNYGIKGASMSSMGPGIFIVSRPDRKLIDCLKLKYSLQEIQLIPNNNGRTVSYA
jgi:beta-ribofuranosylaminobenzene 5'-phosphate synthase